MSLAILKSPMLIDRRLSLGNEPMQPGEVSMVAVDPRVAIEAEVRATLEAQYQAKLDAIKDEARQEGYKDGLATGHLDGQASAMESFRKKQILLEQVLAKAEAQLENWLQSVQTQSVDIAKEALSHFVGEHALNVTVLQNIVKRVTAHLRDADVLAIRLYPTECQVLRGALKQALHADASNRILDKLVEDASLVFGGIVVDTPRGEYRATLDIQLKRMQALLDEQRVEHSPVVPVYHAIRA